MLVLRLDYVCCRLSLSVSVDPLVGQSVIVPCSLPTLVMIKWLWLYGFLATKPQANRTLTHYRSEKMTTKWSFGAEILKIIYN